MKEATKSKNQLLRGKISRNFYKLKDLIKTLKSF